MGVQVLQQGLLALSNVHARQGEGVQLDGGAQ
jgi:hypothetical protein